MMEENIKILSKEGVKSYYKGLTKKEKGLFINYLIINYEFNYHTLTSKLSNNRDLFNKRDLSIMTTVIEQELWKR